MLLFLLLLAPRAMAQTIGGNVYGGGNQAKVGGNSTVTVVSGDIDRVFGGARMSDVAGRALVNIDGGSKDRLASDSSIIINQVYGGNDIAGTIGKADATNPTSVDKVPTELTHVLASNEKQTNNPTKNPVDNSYNAFVRVNSSEDGHTTTGKDDTKLTTSDALYIGSLFAGGNGDYDYDSQDDMPAAGKTTHYIYKRGDLGKTGATPVATVVTASGEAGFTVPNLQKTYLEVTGGSIVYAFGGGNNATVEENTVIHVQNKSKVVNAIFSNGYDKLTEDRILKMGFNPGFTYPHSGDFQIGSFFGGNNRAEMKIRPKWNLQCGRIRNLYSGGNKGAMTSPEGLLLEIDPNESDPSVGGAKLVVDNVFGGCRIADVRPQRNGTDVTCANLPGYYFPNGLSARLLVKGGYINNVYGGNDVTGKVYGGNAIGIYTTVYGDVYGGGNGNYPYTDNEDLKDNDVFGDLYYEKPSGSDMSSDEALNAFRPNAEQVSIRLAGKNATPAGYTVIQGSVFLGGNCASLATAKDNTNPLAELKIGSYVIANNVFLGNNGAGMISENNLKYYAGYVDDDGNYNASDGNKFSSLDLTDASVFKTYMTGVAMPLKPSIVFDSETESDPATYVPFSSFVGSFYCGGNVGSMAIKGKETFTIKQGLNIFEKFVGGCNNADVKAIDGLCADYEGGVIGTEDEQEENGYMEGGKIKDRIEINLENLTITPLRWNDSFTQLMWNTQKWSNEVYTEMEVGTKLEAGDKYYTYSGDVYSEQTTAAAYTVGEGDHFYEKGGFVKVARDPSDSDIRLLGGNVYGGCYESGHVNGNVVININQEMLNKDKVFGNSPDGVFGNPASGVELEDQRDDLMAVALSVFGAGYGEKTEVWGSTTVNHTNGYTFQIYGGGEQGVVGKKNDEGDYDFDPAYSATVNLSGGEGATANANDDVVANLAEAEYIYGGGNEGDVCGNTYVNLGNGRIYDAFGGASDADILGHTEVYIGRQPNGSGGYKDGFPWIRDIVYGGNDFGGTIFGEYEDEDKYNYGARLRNIADMPQLHGYKDGEVPDVLKSSTYVEYLIGRVDTIFGGGYGSYNYTNTALYGVGSAMPVQHSSFVNIRPKDYGKNALKAVFGGGTGYPGNRDGDQAQDRSYVLIDISDDMAAFGDLEAFGGGSYNGLGMKYTFDSESGKTIDESGTAINLDEASAIVDLLHGKIKNAFGGSYQEGVTRRTVVNVPAESTIKIENIFGGAYGKYILPPCDVYEAQVNYKNTSENAQMSGAIYGGNNNERRSLFTQVNISSPVWTNKDKGYTGTVYGAGRGIDTWSEYTEVNLLDGAKVYEAYGGGEMGHVLNSQSIQVYMQSYKEKPSLQISAQDSKWSKSERWEGGVGTGTIKPAYADEWAKDWKNAWTLGSYYEPGVSNGETSGTVFEKYATNAATNLDRISNRPELDANTAAQLDGEQKHNTNVIVNPGAVVDGYIYGGGLGDISELRTGDVYGKTYVAVLGGEVKKDVYAGGRAGGLDNIFEASGVVDFQATANAYVQGGTARNVYGGGYEGHVGHHDGDITTAYTGDRPAQAYVVIGKAGTNTFEGGAPAITRNVYGGGEGGSVYGTSHVTINNGYVGYRYTDNKYVEELKDKTPGDLDLSGNVFGGGYVVNSYVDNSIIKMYGGQVRGSLYGGGEIGPIGRGGFKNATGTGIENGDAKIFKAGLTEVNMYDGKVLRNVFGGGRGKDSWGGDGTMYMDQDLVKSLKADGLFCKGYVFGQTRVNIHGGEVGTDEGVDLGYGNVFGGCDLGSVYSAYEDNGTLCIGKKNGVRYDKLDNHEGYYYKYENNAFKTSGSEYILTEDCKVVVEPWCLAKSPVEINGTTYPAGTYVPTSALNYLGNKSADAYLWNVLGKSDVNKEGVIIHNAVFAGGNVTSGSTDVYANTPTVFGNATASIHDVYNRDLISIGRGRVGGLYGDGNLTLVDGYRELNITNYGTDYYHITPEISLATYKALPNREAAYYEIRYKCVNPCTDKDGKTYVRGSTITADEMQTVFDTKTVVELTPIVDSAGNPVLDDDGYPTYNTTTNNVSMLDASGKPRSYYWQENGVCSRYAGRPMNTIQRADFCGVFGSRMVMQGAQDRVPETVDYTNYTINRVREVSLNKKVSVRSGDASDSRNAEHGNYFGIYSVVNFLGALTSDFDFYGDNGYIRTTDNSDAATYKCDAEDADKNPIAYGAASFADWKRKYPHDRRRNNGNSHNRVALASGVYLELTTEKSTGTDLYQKDWGYITGVVELDLINVQTGIGGGYVYAKNEHGVRSTTGKNQTILTALNAGAITNKKFQYTTAEDSKLQWETSGNFVHSTQTIIDDCYNIGGKYLSNYNKPDGVPAHYWFIKGSVYIYDQYISAYTGSPNAYSEVVNIPLTITSASHGKMTLLNVMPNRYAYYSVNSGSTQTTLDEDKKIALREKEYGWNDAINYWDYSQLTSSEKGLFVEKTYIVTADCTYGTGENPVTYKAGTVLLPGNPDGSEEGTYYYLKNHAPTKKLNVDDTGETPYVHHVGKNQDVDFDYVFRPSNNVSHGEGYILTYSIDNPNQWNTWYTPKSGTSQTGKVDSKEIKDKTRTDYEDGPTYTPDANGMYGQNDYAIGSIISEEEYTTYGTAYAKLSDAEKAALGKQASFYPAYIVTTDLLEATNNSSTAQRFYKGATLSKEDYIVYNSDGSIKDQSKWDAISGSVAEALVVTSTIQLSPTEYIYRGSYMTAAEKTTLYDKYKNGTDAEKKIAKEINENIVKAYYCTEEGKYGGDYFQTGHNYRGLAAFSSMSKTDRENFTFNYDALDLLIDPDYSRAEGVKYQYDGKDYTTAEQVKAGNKATYSLATPIDYSATYQGSSSLTYIADADADDDGNLIAGHSLSTANNGTVLSRTEYERLPNEQYYYAPITVDAVGEGVKYYVVNKTLVLGDTPYAAGQVISKDTYDGLSGDLNSTDPKDHGDKAYVDVLTFSSTGTYYYCREGYTIPNNADGHAITSATGVTGAKGGDYAKNKLVPTGVVINEGMYETLTNQQKNFAIHGLAPTETSTLYVPRNSDILDLSAEKIITVIYQYDYVESDADGKHITPVSERHILNIHLNFKSGIPIVEDIQAPKIVLPGTSVTMPEPYVTPGAYEITGSGWELFDDEGDAESHVNGVEYVPSFTPLYLYQNKYYLAYYTKTYLGKTYSNYVPVTVANYHDLKKVFEAKKDHYFIDHKDLFKTGNIIEPKIYINDYSKDAEGSKNGLDLFKDLYDLSVLTGYTVDSETGLISSASFTGHKPLDEKVKNGNNLEFFMRTDIDHSTKPNPAYDSSDPESPARIPDPWTPIASSSGECFQGTLHGDGHTISGLDNSLFGHLCGDVYNLGVTGSFTSAGVADDGGGYVENCWINTTGTPDNNVYAVFGNPNAADKPKQIVNCYYQDREDTNYKSDPAEHGVATPKPQQAFYNGEVAYDLNGFYLYKRYSDKQAAPTNEDAKAKEQYQHYIIDADNKVVLQPVAYYSVNADNQYTSTGYLPSGYDAATYVVPMYVEDRFADGDFRYAAGTIPTEADIRTYTDPEDATNEYFFPIWPDDYFFFGQKLTYGYGAYAHQDVPSAVVREDGLLSSNDDANRVYRAPAYFRSKDMGVAHFNPTVYLAQKEKLTDEQIEANETARKAYPGMTAIDFAGHNDNTWGIGSVSSGFPAGSPAFYPPLLDDDGLTSIQNCDETQNLLVYAPAETSTDGYANAKTNGVLTTYFKDPEYTTYYDKPDGYRLVREAPSGMVHGHLVQSDLKATDDHLLVDKQDFNCPIAYDFDGNHRMWYQRMPADEEFVDRNKGWQGVSIPFTAELVTTDDKGEITHFYSGSDKSQNGTTKGHEYWLREMTNESTLKQVGETKVLLADFHYPNAAGANKKVTNTFLWDYYYQNTDVHDQKDKNADIYLQYRQYYNGSRTYNNYPLLSAAKPYILGLPDKTYYEFDLSGKFEAENTAVSIPRLDKQTITFASDTHEHIGVSDDEMTGTKATYSGSDYYFMPSYMNWELTGTNNYVLNSEGNAYIQLSAVPETYKYEGKSYSEPEFKAELAKGTTLYSDESGMVVATTWDSGITTYYKRIVDTPSKNDQNHVSPSVSAFRPYFYVPGAAHVKGMLPSSIVFSGTNGEFEETPESALDGSLEIFSRGRNIVTRSHMKEPTTIRIVNAAGITLANFVLPAGQTIETPVHMPGVYIVNKKKLSIQ